MEEHGATDSDWTSYLEVLRSLAASGTMQINITASGNGWWGIGYDPISGVESMISSGIEGAKKGLPGAVGGAAVGVFGGFNSKDLNALLKIEYEYKCICSEAGWKPVPSGMGRRILVKEPKDGDDLYWTGP